MTNILGLPTLPFYIGILPIIILTFICNEMSLCIKVLLNDYFFVIKSNIFFT
jgi:hypothetical protein